MAREMKAKEKVVTDRERRDIGGIIVLKVTATTAKDVTIMSVGWHLISRLVIGCRENTYLFPFFYNVLILSIGTK